ncbi:MAG: response regulator [Elusimicrobiota bacterium]
MMEKILIIDDFEPVRKVITRIVEREKFIAFQACDGKEGLEVFERERPEVIITDLKMPNIDGRGVLSAVKTHHPETEVIVLTGYGDNETAQFLLKNGAFSYLKKPLDLHQLVKILTDVRKKLHQDNSKTVPLLPFAQTKEGEDVNIQLTPDGKINVLWEGDLKEGARQFISLGAGSLAIPIIILNENWEILYSNHAFEKMVGGKISHLNDSALLQIRSHGINLAPPQKFLETLKQLISDDHDVKYTADINALGDIIIFKVFIVKTVGSKPVLVLSFPRLMV